MAEYSPEKMLDRVMSVNWDFDTADIDGKTYTKSDILANPDLKARLTYQSGQSAPTLREWQKRVADATTPAADKALYQSYIDEYNKRIGVYANTGGSPVGTQPSTYEQFRQAQTGALTGTQGGRQLTPEQLALRTKAMLAQTAAEGSKPFAGSSYERDYLSSIGQNTPVTGQLGALGQSGGQYGGQSSAPPRTSPPAGNANNLANQYQALIGQSPEEIAAQKAIDEQNNAMRAGVQNVQEQPIGMSFISGQQASLENRNVNLQIPLQQRLANAQQKRQASLDAIKFQLERSDVETARQDTLAEQRANEAYRQAVLNKGEGFSLGEGEKRYDASGNLIAYGGPKTYAPDKSTSGELSDTDYSHGLNYVLVNGDANDVERFKTDRAFQAWVMSQI